MRVHVKNYSLNSDIASLYIYIAKRPNRHIRQYLIFITKNQLIDLINEEGIRLQEDVDASVDNYVRLTEVLEELKETFQVVRHVKKGRDLPARTEIFLDIAELDKYAVEQLLAERFSANSIKWKR